MRHPEFPIASFLSLPLLLCSLPSHIRSGSVSIIALIAWLAVMSIIRGTNALIWADNIVVRFEVWCDISTKITIGFTYAVPASALCVLRHLENIASARRVLTTKADKRRRQMLEAVMCFGVPILFMTLHYVVQGHRYDLIENFGCYPTQYFSIAALFILWIPPLFMSLISFVYAGLALRHFLRHRISFSSHLQNSQSSITPGRYLRLMALAIVEMAWDTGINTYILCFNIKSGFQPWISWDNVHSNFSRVATFPEWIFPPIFITQLIWQWWIIPISCIFFFLFFSFGEEAMSDYRLVISWFRKIFFLLNVPKSHPPGLITVIPLQSPRVHASIDTSLSYKYGEDLKTWGGSFKEGSMQHEASLSSTGVDAFNHQGALSSTMDKHASDASEWHCSLSRSTSVASPSCSEPLPRCKHDQSAMALASPKSESSATGGCDPPPCITDASPASFQLHYTGRSADHHYSSSTDQGLTVSPAYLADSRPGTIHHDEDALFIHDAHYSSTPSTMQSAKPPSTGGIHVTVMEAVI